MSPLAYLTPSRQLRLVDAKGNDRALSGEIGGISFGSWTAAPEESHSWPTFSPDNTHIASFSMPQGTDGQPRVMVNSLDGITSEHLATLHGRLPIYMQWAEDGHRLALLTQEREKLVLSQVKRGRLGEEDRLLEGSPMFFTWWKDALAVFAGGPPANVDPATRHHLAGAELVVLDETQLRRLPRVPGNFCAPVCLGDRIVYVGRDPGSSEGGSPTPSLLLSQPDGQVRELRPIDGLAAIVRSPEGGRLALATAEGESAPYRDLRLLDLETGGERLLSDDPCMAFFWSRDGTLLVRASVDTSHNSLRWDTVNLDGNVRFLFEVHPTRDMTFYLRFFEQYCQSHPLVSPDGQSLLVTGAKRGESVNRPVVWRVPLSGGPAEEIAPGMFGVYAW